MLRPLLTQPSMSHRFKGTGLGPHCPRRIWQMLLSRCAFSGMEWYHAPQQSKARPRVRPRRNLIT